MDSFEGPEYCQKPKAVIEKFEQGYKVKYKGTDAQFFREIPTIEDPDITVRLGIKAKVMEIIYPERFSREEIDAITLTILKQFADPENKCKMCSRTIKEIIEREIVEKEILNQSKDVKSSDPKSWGL